MSRISQAYQTLAMRRSRIKQCPAVQRNGVVFVPQIQFTPLLSAARAADGK